MLAPTRSLDDAPSFAGVRIGPLLLAVVLAVLLAFTTLSQVFFAVPNPRLFVRWMELLFVGLFLVVMGMGRSYHAPALHPAVGWLVVGWLIASSLSVVLAGNVGHALLRQAEWLTHLLFATTLWSLLRRYPPLLKVVLVAVPLGFFMVGLKLFSIWMTVPNPRTFDWFYGMPLLTHARHLGYYGLAALIFSACPLLGMGDTVTKRERGLALVALTVCWGFLFWTGGRAAIGSGIIGLALMTWFAGKDQRTWTAAAWIVAALLGLWLSTLFWTEDPKMGFFNALDRTAEASTAQGVNGFTTGRLTIWRVALDASADHLWFGLGPDGYKFIPVPHHGIQPHGMLVQFFVEWGLVGTIPFLALLATVFWTGFVRMLRETDPLLRTARITAFALILSCTIHSLVDGLYYHPQPMLFLFTGFAVVLLPLTASKEQTSQTPLLLRALTSRYTLWAAATLLGLLFLLNSDFFTRLLYT